MDFSKSLISALNLKVRFLFSTPGSYLFTASAIVIFLLSGSFLSPGYASTLDEKLLEQARTLEISRRYREALQIFEKLSKRGSNRILQAMAIMGAASCNLELGEVVRAVKLARKIISMELPQDGLAISPDSFSRQALALLPHREELLKHYRHEIEEKYFEFDFLIPSSILFLDEDIILSGMLTLDIAKGKHSFEIRYLTRALFSRDPWESMFAAHTLIRLLYREKSLILIKIALSSLENFLMLEKSYPNHREALLRARIARRVAATRALALRARRPGQKVIRAREEIIESLESIPEGKAVIAGRVAGHTSFKREIILEPLEETFIKEHSMSSERISVDEKGFYTAKVPPGFYRFILARALDCEPHVSTSEVLLNSSQTIARIVLYDRIKLEDGIFYYFPAGGN